MRAPGPAPRPGRLYPWAATGLILLFAFLIVSDRYAITNPPSHYAADEDLAEELKTARLPEDASQPSLAGPWPQWRGPRRDGVAPDVGLAMSWPAKGPRVLWRADCGEGYSSVTVAAGRAFTHMRTDRENETVICWDAITGDEQWRVNYPCQYWNQYGSGPRSTPTVDGDRVYTVGATGILHCLKTEDGEKVWAKDLLKEYDAVNREWGVAFSPLIEGDLVLTMPGGSGGKSLVALDKHTGKEVWRALDDPASFSSPIAATLAGERQLVFLTGNALVGVSPRNGTLHWRYPWQTHAGVNVATPIARGDYLFLSTGYNKGCAVLKVRADGRGGFEVRRVYESSEMCNHFASCVLYGEHLYGVSGDNGILTCMEFRTGKVCWENTDFGKGSLLVADGHLLLLSDRGRLVLAEATPEEYREKAAFAAFRRGDKCWTMPVLADGRLYLRNQKQVVCLDLKNP